jgi:hypothetical protein
MFPESRIESEFLNEFYIMDVILNRAPSPLTMGDLADDDDGRCHGVNPDVVRPFRSYEPEDILPEKDYCYRAAVLFCLNVASFTAIGSVAGEMSVYRVRSLPTI